MRSVQEILRGLDKVNAQLNATSGELELIRAKLFQQSQTLDYARKHPVEWLCRQLVSSMWEFNQISRELAIARNKIELVDSTIDYSSIIRKIENVRGELLSAVAEARLVSRNS